MKKSKRFIKKLENLKREINGLDSATQFILADRIQYRIMNVNTLKGNNKLEEIIEIMINEFKQLARERN